MPKSHIKKCQNGISKRGYFEAREEYEEETYSEEEYKVLAHF
jgi:hypothetical protein